MGLVKYSIEERDLWKAPAQLWILDQILPRLGSLI